MSQRTANELAKKYSDEEENSIVQRYIKKHPMAKLAALMGRPAVSMAAGLAGAGGGAAAGGLAGVGAITGAANKQQENRRVVDYKRAQALEQSNKGSMTGMDFARSGMNSIQSLSNPLMGAFLASQAAGLMGVPGADAVGTPLMQASLASRSPLMALKVAAGAGLTNGLFGGGAEGAIKSMTETAAENGAMGTFGLGTSMLPSTLMHLGGGAVGALGSGLSSAGSFASDTMGLKMLGGGMGAAGEAAGTAATSIGTGADSLLNLISGAADAGGFGGMLGPALGIATMMAAGKPMNKMMGAVREKATGTKMQQKGSAIRPRITQSSQLSKKYTLTRPLQQQFTTGINLGMIPFPDSIQISALLAIEQQIAAIVGRGDESAIRAEHKRTGANTTQNKMQSKLEQKGGDELTSVYEDKKKGWAGFKEGWDSPGKKLKGYAGSAALGLEKTALSAGALINPTWLLGGKYSLGNKFKDIFAGDQKKKATEELSKKTGISVSGVISMETTLSSLMSQGDTVEQKQLSVMGGTYELIRTSTFFLQDIRKKLGVTEKESMMGKLDALISGTEKKSDERGLLGKGIQGTFNFLEKIPGLSPFASVAGGATAGINRIFSKTSSFNKNVGGVADDLFDPGAPVASDHDKMFALVENFYERYKRMSDHTFDELRDMHFTMRSCCGANPLVDTNDNNDNSDSIIWQEMVTNQSEMIILQNEIIEWQEKTVSGIGTGNRVLLNFQSAILGHNSSWKDTPFGSTLNNIEEYIELIVDELTVPGMKAGGEVKGGTPNVDSVRIKAMEGEIMINKKVAQENKASLLNLNNGGSFTAAKGSADATDAKLEADQAEHEKIGREIKMVDTVVNIERLLEKCCGGGGKWGLAKDKDKSEDKSKAKGKLGIIGDIAKFVGYVASEAALIYIFRDEFKKILTPMLKAVTNMVSDWAFMNSVENNKKFREEIRASNLEKKKEYEKEAATVGTKAHETRQWQKRNQENAARNPYAGYDKKEYLTYHNEGKYSDEITDKVMKYKMERDNIAKMVSTKKFQNLEAADKKKYMEEHNTIKVNNMSLAEKKAFYEVLEYQEYKEKNKALGVKIKQENFNQTEEYKGVIKIKTEQKNKEDQREKEKETRDADSLSMSEDTVFSIGALRKDNKDLLSVLIQQNQMIIEGLDLVAEGGSASVGMMSRVASSNEVIAGRMSEAPEIRQKDG